MSDLCIMLVHWAMCLVYPAVDGLSKYDRLNYDRGLK